MGVWERQTERERLGGREGQMFETVILPVCLLWARVRTESGNTTG